MFNLAGLVFSLGLFYILIQLIPSANQNFSTYYSLAMTIVGFYCSFTLPRLLTGAGKTASGSISANIIGGLLLISFFVLSSLVLLIGAIGFQVQIVWILNVICSVLFLGGLLTLRATISFLDKNFPDSETVDVTSRKNIILTLEKVKFEHSEVYYSIIDDLIDNLRYSSDDPKNFKNKNNEKIIDLIQNKLIPAIAENDKSSIKHAQENIISQIKIREANIKAFRSIK